MLTKEITIGMKARVLIGDRLAVVTVMNVSKYSRGREAYRCLTEDTGRMITATAKRLRPIPGTPEAAAERARKLAAQRRRESQPRDAKPAAIQPPLELVPPQPVPGMFAVVNQSRLLERLSGFNHRGVSRILDSVHVSASWRDACRAVFAVIGKGGRLRAVPVALRRGCWQAVAELHAINRRNYTEVMGAAAGPSEEMITAAMLGDAAARAAVLAS
jgi:hypothetical protein